MFILVQNHCYAKHVCGRGGECMNFGLTYRCRCNFLYHGRKCDKCKFILMNNKIFIFFFVLVSSKATQSIIALSIIILMGLAAFCLKFDIYSYCQSKKKYVQIYLK